MHVGLFGSLGRVERELVGRSVADRLHQAAARLLPAALGVLDLLLARGGGRRGRVTREDQRLGLGARAGGGVDQALAAHAQCSTRRT